MGSKKEIIDYKGKKVVIKGKPTQGDNVPVYIRPGDQVEFQLPDIDPDQLEYKLVGGDIIIKLPEGGEFTFVSMGLMGFSSKHPAFKLAGAKTLTLDDILSKVEEVNDVPVEKVPATLETPLPIEEPKAEKEEKKGETPPQPQVVVIEVVEEKEKEEENENIGMYTEEPKESPEVIETPFTADEVPKKISNKTEEAKIEGIDPVLTFDIDVQHLNPIEKVLDRKFYFYGGSGGEKYANDYILQPDGEVTPNKSATFSEFKKQISPENINLIGKEFRDGDVTRSIDELDRVVIYADNPDYVNEEYTARVIRLSPNQPVGFAIEKLQISGLPEGVEIIGGVSAGGGAYTIERSETGDYKDGFVETSTIDFVIKYKRDLVKNFIAKIEAESHFSQENVPEGVAVETPVKISITADMEFGFNIKEVDADVPSSFNYTPVTNEEGEEIAGGFVLATNYIKNIIETSHNHADVYGSKTDDIVISKEGDDFVQADDGDDSVYTNEGNDTVYGGKGDDFIELGAGDDTVDGGEGIDTLSYEHLKKEEGEIYGVNVNLKEGVGTGDGNDVIANIENVRGSNYIDTIEGDDSDNVLMGEKGNDTILGGGGNDTIDGGAGRDAVSFKDSSASVTVKLLSDEARESGEDFGEASGNGTDKLLNIENVIGSDFDDTISGNVGNNTLDGGAGIDTLDMSMIQSAKAVVNLSQNYSSGDGEDTILNIENVIGTDLRSLSDTLIGDNGDNLLDGRKGDDTLEGKDGDDSLIGGFGNDKLKGGLGDDFIDGGEDIDTVDYSDISSAVAVSLSEENPQDTGGAGTDTIRNIENVIATPYDDTITGSLEKNTIDGGGGNDTVVFDYATSGVKVELNDDDTGEADKGNVEKDELKNIENITGSAYDDTLSGNNKANILKGAEGNDYIIGNEGDDTIDGEMDLIQWIIAMLPWD